MAIFVTIPINVPQTLQLTPEMISQSVSPLVQEYVDDLARQQQTLPKMSYAELEQSISLKEAFARLREKNHQYYAK